MQLELSRQIFEDYSNIKFHENPSSGSRVVPRGRTDVTKIILDFHNFENAPKSHLMLYREIIAVCSEIHTKHVNTVCGLNVEFVNVKPGGSYSNYWALHGYVSQGKELFFP